jgi:Protein of unknown function (DUF1566)
VVVDIEFQALAVGISPLTLANAFLTDNNVFLSSANGDFTLQNGQVTVTGVPEPGTLPLLSLALAFAFCIYRGRRTMKHSILAGVMLAALVLANGPAKAVTTEAGPYYSLPSWDQTLPASTRFIVLSNLGSAAVLDRETGLVWEQTPSGAGTAVSWAFAVDACNLANTGGRFGWRLPSVQELSSLIDPTQPTGLPAGNPFQGAALGSFWTATTSATNTTAAFTVSFVNFGELVVPPKTNSTNFTVWCVRGGSGAQNPQ